CLRQAGSTMTGWCGTRRNSLRSGQGLFRDEVSGMTPFAAHDEFADGLADTWRHLQFAVGFGQRSSISVIAHRECFDGVPSRRDVEHVASGVGIETGHL